MDLCLCEDGGQRYTEENSLRCFATGKNFAVDYIATGNLTGCVVMNITLAATPTVRRESVFCSCFQSSQMQKERICRREDANIFPIRDSGHNENYRQITLPWKVTAFFLTTCLSDDQVIPLDSNDRIYVIDDKDGFPPKLARSTIELRKKNIWVVQSRSRASRQHRVSRFLGMKKDKCSCGTSVSGS